MTTQRAIGLGLLLSAACSAPPPREAPLVDCRGVDEEYEFQLLQQFTAGAEIPWFGVVDASPGGRLGNDDPTTLDVVEHNPEVVDIDDVRERGRQEPGRCGNTAAGLFEAGGYTDWGGFFAEYATVAGDIADMEEWEGFSFWARTGRQSDRSFLFAVDNAHTAPVDEANPENNLCVQELTEDAGVGNTRRGTGEFPPGTDPTTVCGNSFQKLVTTNQHWQLFTIPFSDLVQSRAANVRAEGFDPTVKLVRLRLGFRTETRFELWLDDLGLYRRWDR